MGTLYNAIAQNNWWVAKASIDRYPRALDIDFAASIGETPLHVAVKFGHVGIVEELVRLVPHEYLKIRDAYYDCTPLATAAIYSGVIPNAACLINENNNALAIPSKNGWRIPVTLAFIGGLTKMGRYLYSVTPLQFFKPENGPVGPTFLYTCLRIGQLDFALDLLQQCTELLFAADVYGISTIQNIARYPPNFLNKSTTTKNSTFSGDIESPKVAAETLQRRHFVTTKSLP
ncbi:uncharacterized protein LOC114717894 [Neltuma alba]|uniref:uncharacterized protein LOC114717894 n=1 Tax=Neltuma alba TaxID=207710 RepID=UPI0010A56993|nr:uncharacterized protein LOC114717894 [Prosopis alba]